MLKKELIDKIRDVIKSPSDNWTHISNNNCYMYALRIDMDLDEFFSKKKNFMVGSFSDTVHNLGDRRQLERSLYADMDVLGINIDTIESDAYHISNYDLLETLTENEWQIALYRSAKPINLPSGILVYDYHLIRKDYNDRNWKHKTGIYTKPSKVKFKLFKEKTPININYYMRYNNEKIYYDYVGTYKVSVK